MGLTKSPFLADHVEDFKAFFQSENRTPKTLESYTYTLLNYSAKYNVINNTTVASYLAGNIPSTYNKKLTHLKAFTKYLIGEGVPDVQAISLKKKKVPDTVPIILDLTNIDKVIAVCKKSYKREFHQVGYFLSLIRETGMRFSEVMSLDGGEAGNTIYGPYIKFTGKGGKERTNPLTKEGWQAYCGWTRSQRSHPINERTLRRYLSRAVKKALGEDVVIRPKDLRSTFGMDARQGGADYDTIADWMGHSDTKITRRYYARIDQRNLTRILTHVKVSRDQRRDQI